MVLKKILLTGGSGTLGTELKRLKPDLLCPSSKELDITKKENVEKYIIENNPDLIIHAAAYTNVSKAETDFEKAIDVNINGTYNLLKSCIHNGIKIIYISTDYVFDGEKGNYTIEDPVNPLTKYAKSKTAAELMVRMYENSLVIRTSFYNYTFPYEYAFIDQWSSKDYIDVIAPKIIKHILSDELGIIHCVSKRRTIYEIAKERNPNIKKATRKSFDFPIPKDTSLI